MKPTQSEYYRQSLLPKWIKFFCYIFMAQASLIPFALLFVLYHNASLSIYIYGLVYKTSSFDLISAGFMALYIFLGFSVVTIMLGKKWAIYLGIIQGFMGIIIPLGVILKSGFYVPVEPIIFIPWTIKMFKIKKEWLSDNITTSNNLGLS